MYKQRHILIHISVILGLLLSPFGLWGQKLHNERRDKIMQDVKKQFGELINPDTNIFEQAIKNAQATNEADLAELRERNRALLESVATTMPFMTWGEIRELALEARQQASNLEGPPADTNTNQSGNDSVPTAHFDAKNASSQIANIQAQIGKLEKEIGNSDQTQTPTIAEIEQILEDAVANGKIPSVKTLITKSQQLPEKFVSLKNIIQRLQPQGLSRVILETTLSRYRNELARLQLRQQHLEALRTAVLNFQNDLRAYAGTATSKGDCSAVQQAGATDFGNFLKFLSTVCSASHPPEEQILPHLQELANRARELTPDAIAANKQLVNELINLSRLLNLLGASRYGLLEQISNLSHDELVFQIRLMQLDAREHETLLNGGVTGLAAYEAGGIKPEDVANIISMAQALATSAIAARLK